LDSLEEKTLIQRERRIERRKETLPIPFEDRRFLERRHTEIELEKDTVVPRYSMTTMPTP